MRAAGDESVGGGADFPGAVMGAEGVSTGFVGRFEILSVCEETSDGGDEASPLGANSAPHAWHTAASAATIAWQREQVIDVFI